MSFRFHFIPLIMCLFFLSCSTDTPQTPENTSPLEVIEETENLDSLNQQIEKSTLEIEKSIQSVEEAMDDLSNFE